MCIYKKYMYQNFYIYNSNQNVSNICIFKKVQLYSIFWYLFVHRFFDASNIVNQINTSYILSL